MARAGFRCGVSTVPSLVRMEYEIDEEEKEECLCPLENVTIRKKKTKKGGEGKTPKKEKKEVDAIDEKVKG